MKRGNRVFRFFDFNLQFFIVLLLISFLSIGCSSSDDDAPVVSSPDSNSTVSGVASKGPVNGGDVSAYEIRDGEKVEPALGTATSSANGDYSIDIGGYTGPVLIEIEGGTYKDEATGAEIALTMTLRAAIGNASGEVTVAVTPLTELAVKKAELGGLTPDKIDSSNKLISQLLGGKDCTEDLITQTRPVDVTNEAACDDADDEQKQYGLLLAALSQMVETDTYDDIQQVIDDIERDLDDITLDETGSALSAGLTAFLGSGYNETGISADEDITEAINEAITGLTPTGSLGEAKGFMADFFKEPTEVNYNIFIDYMNSFVADSKEAYLFKAIASLFDIYNNTAVSLIISELGIDFDTDFDILEYENVLNKFLNIASYDEDIIELFAAIEVQLDDVYENLELAKGVNADISLTGFDTVYFDDVDVKVLSAITKVLKAGCAYVQAVDFSIESWDVTVAGTETDIRDLIKADVIIENDQIAEFFDNNENLLTYLDEDKLSNLSNFTTAFEDAVTQFSTAVTALDDLGESGRKARYKNAFNLDSEFGLWMVTAIAEKTLPSILAAFDNREEDVIFIDDEEISEKIADGEDGYYYWQGTFNINLEYHEPDPDGGITIYDIVIGDNSPRDVFLAENAVEDYSPYIFDDDPKVYKENVTEVYWDHPIDTYTVPLAAIEIDGKKDDWGNSVPVFYESGGSSIKIARDTEGNFYLYVSNPNGFEEDNHYSFGKWMPGVWESYDVQLNYSSYNGFALEAYTYSSSNNDYNEAEASETIKSSGDIVIGIEVKYSANAFDELTEAGSLNYFHCSFSGNYYDKQIKLLPEATVK